MNLILSKSVAYIVFISVLTKTEKIFISGYIAVLLHELSHLATCRYLKITPKKLSVTIFGMELEIPPATPISKRIAISAVGPLASFILFLLCVFLRQTFSVNITVFEFSNLCIALVNLIPSMPLDGGCIIKSILESRFGIIRGLRIMNKVTALVISLLAAVCVGIFYSGYFNISILMFIYFLIRSLKNEHKRQLLEKKYVLSGEIHSKKTLKYEAVESSCELLTLAEMISPSYFLVVAVFENGKFKGEINQHQILYNIQNKCNYIHYAEKQAVPASSSRS